MVKEQWLGRWSSPGEGAEPVAGSVVSVQVKEQWLGRWSGPGEGAEPVAGSVVSSPGEGAVPGSSSPGEGAVPGSSSPVEGEQNQCLGRLCPVRLR